MTERELRNLSRTDLLEMLLAQSRELEQVRAELEEAKQKLTRRELAVQQAGSMAEAALLLNGVFEAADKACEQYKVQIQQQAARCAKMEEETRMKCEKMLEEAKNQAETYWNTMSENVDQLMDPQWSGYYSILDYID